MVTSIGLCLLAARAHGLAILDGVHLDLSDDAGLAEICRQDVVLGFDGETLIHPKTLGHRKPGFWTRHYGCGLGTPGHQGPWRCGGGRIGHRPA